MEVSGTFTLPNLLADKVGEHPDKACIVFEDDHGGERSLSYQEFGNAVDRLSSALVVAGVRPGDKVALMMGNCVEFLIAWFAICRAGAAMVSVNVFNSRDELQFLLDHSQSIAFLTEPRFVQLFQSIADACVNVRIRWCGRTEHPQPGFRLLSEVLASVREVVEAPGFPASTVSQIVYTSGTTSRPKGVVISHSSSVIQAVAVSQTLGMRDSDRTCVVLPLFHVNGQYIGVLPTLAVGGTIVLLETYSAGCFWRQVRDHRCTLISIVPMQLRTLLMQAPDVDDRQHDVRLAFYALATTDSEWDAFESRFGVRLVEGYGLSETLGICTCNPVMHGRIKRHSVGVPVLGRQVRIVGEDRHDMAPGQVGRVVVRGEPLFSGYFRNPEATAAVLGDGWLDTGDNGYFDEQGYLYFFDRAKDIIKRAGENIAASEVERVLNEHASVAESAVIAVPDPLREEAVKAFIVLTPGAPANEAALRAWCAERLAKFKVPSFFEFLPALPKTSIGKIQKSLLKEREMHAAPEPERT